MEEELLFDLGDGKNLIAKKKLRWKGLRKEWLR